MDQLTAAQKLGRLKLITKALNEIIENDQGSARVEEVRALDEEHRAILASVGAPPLELIGNPWGEAWATAFADQFPGFDKETLELWFMNACAAGAQAGMRDAERVKRDESPLREALNDILNGVVSKAIRCPGAVLVNGERATLEEYIEGVLRLEPAPSVARAEVVDTIEALVAEAAPAPPRDIRTGQCVGNAAGGATS